MREAGELQNREREGAPIWRVSLLQGFFFIAYGAGIPFFSLYFKNVLVRPDGVPAHYLIGSVFFIQALLGILATPVAGFICDKFKIENRLLTVFSVFVVFAAAILSMPGFKFSMTWTLDRKYLFILIGFMINGLFVKPIIPLLDTETLNSLHSRFHSGIRYGQVRVFGSLGWLISASLFGWILQRTGQLNTIVFGYGSGFIILAFVAAGGFHVGVKPERIPWEYLKQDRMYQRFLVFVFFQALGLLSAFIFTSYFMDDIQTSYLIIGASFGLAAIPEIPIMFYSKVIIEAMGNRWMIVVGTLVESVKLLLFVIIARTMVLWMLIPAQLLHGIGYSLQYTGMINLVDRQAHVNLRATYQSLFHLFTLLAGAFGGLFGSFIIKKQSSSWLMGIDGVILFLSILYFLIRVRGHGPLRNAIVS